MTAPSTPAPADLVEAALKKARKFTRQAQDARGRAYRRTGGTATAEREFANASRYDDKADEQFAIVEMFIAAHNAHMASDGAEKASIQCVGCEGKPAPENDPCGICGGSGRLFALTTPQPDPRDADQCQTERCEKQRNDLYDRVLAQQTDMGVLKAQIAELRGALAQLLTRCQMEMRNGRLPIDWADPTILIARTALAKSEGK